VKVIGNLTKDAIIRAAVSEGLTFTQAAGTPVDFDTVATTSAKIAFDSSNNKVVVAYTDQGDTYEGNAVVGTVDPSNNSISFGTPVAFYSGETGNDYLGITFDSNSNKIVIVYSNVDESNDGYAVVGTVSGTSISFGTPVEWSPNNTTMLDCTFDSSNNKVVITYKDQTNSNYGTAIVGTVSGTSISFGSAVVFNSNNTSYPQATFDTSNNKVVITYRNQSTTHATAIVGTVSGTSISFGSATAWHTSSSTYQSITFDSTNNKVIVVANQSGGYAAVGTVSGTSISFGSVVNFASGSAEYNAAAFDSNTGKVVIVYKQSSTDRPALIVGEVSGTSISFGTAITLQSETTNGNRGVTFDSNAKKIVTVYKDSDDNRGEAVVFQTAGSVASGGTIADGKPVIVNANGTVSTVSQTSVSEDTGTGTVFETGNTAYPSCSYDTVENKTLIVWSDGSSSYEGQAAVATVSGTSISFGSVVTWASGNKPKYMDSVYDVASGKHVIVYEDDNNNDYGTAVVATVSGTSVSFGTPVVFDSQSTEFLGISYDSTAQKVVIAYRDFGTSIEGRAVVGTVSGTSISFGSTVSFTSATADYFSPVYDSANDKTVVFYRDANNSDHGTAKVGTVSGTSISFGSAVVFEAANSTHIRASYDSSAGKTLVVYSDEGDSQKGKGVVGTVSGTSISFGSAATFNGGQSTYMDAIYHPLAKKVFVSYTKNTSSDHKIILPATISGTSVTFGSEVTLLSDQSIYGKAAYDSTSKVLVVVYRGTSNDRGYASVYQAAYDETTLTTENFVGFMDGAALDGTNGEILSSCSIARNQTSLTAGQTYFVLPTGALSTTAGSPSVTAGTAISSTELIVKG